MKHTNDIGPCPACEEKLTQAHQDLSQWFRIKVKPLHQDCHISWSYRGKQDQETAFLDGKTKLHYPNSDHNKVDAAGLPCSRALDFFELDYNGQARWAWGYFKKISDENIGEPVFWGGHYPHLGDADHFAMHQISTTDHV